MGKVTGIAWTDHTFNPWIGCTEASPGCDNCYARALAARMGVEWGEGKDRRLTSKSNWMQPLRWNADAAKAGVKRLVFCASLADVMDGAVPQEWRERLWALIDATPNLIWLLLTKHPQLYDKQLPRDFIHGNVILGATAEDQSYYDIRWPHLARAAGHRMLQTFISHEPAVGPLRPTQAGKPFGRTLRGMAFVYPDWIITGGESGGAKKVRPYDFRWASMLVRWGSANGVPIFVKQMGDVPVLHYPLETAGMTTAEAVAYERTAASMWPDGTHFGNRTGNPALNGLQVLLNADKGGNPEEWPEELRVQQFPVERPAPLVNPLEVLP